MEKIRIPSEKYPVIGWCSGGATSAVACKLAIDLFGIANVRLVFIDTKNEDSDTYRFLADCEKWYEKRIEVISNRQIKEREYNLSLGIFKP